MDYNSIKNYFTGEAHAVSLKISKEVVSADRALCMYDFAEQILKNSVDSTEKNFIKEKKK